MVSYDLVLASTSPYRKQLLARLGVPFRSIDPNVDEEPAKKLGLAPADLALKLALQKAQSVAARETSAIVLGSDQVVEVDGEILGKPGTVERAVEQLLRLSGRTHRLLTAIAMGRAGKWKEHVEVTEMELRPFGRAQAELYVREESPLDCAGSYKFEAGGIRLMKRVSAPDPTAIIGLPLMKVGDWLGEFGMRIP